MNKKGLSTTLIVVIALVVVIAGVLIYYNSKSLQLSPRCTPATCLILEKQCGSWSNRCGKNITCGVCQAGYACRNGACVAIIRELSLVKMKTNPASSYISRGRDSNGAVIDYNTSVGTNGAVTITYKGDIVNVDTDNSQYGRIKFTSARAGGIRKLLNFVYDNNTASTAVQAVLAHDATNADHKGYIHVVKGEYAREGDWVVVDSGDFGRILEVNSISADTATTGRVYFEDVITGDKFEIALTNTSTKGYTATTTLHDGQTYTITMDSFGREFERRVNLTGGTAGTYTGFPKIRLTNGNWIAIGTLNNFRQAYNLGVSGNMPAILFIEDNNNMILVPTGTIGTAEIAISRPLATATTTGI